MQSRRAFSLVELLVVMFILALLLGILMPTLPRIMDNARRTVCSSNLRNVAQGVELHRDVHEERFPKARYMPPPWLSGDEDPPLNEALADFLDPVNEVYHCPGDHTVFSTEYVDDEGLTRNCGMSYTYIVSLSGAVYEETFYARFLRHTPSDTPMAHDFDGGTFETQDGELVSVDFFHTTRNVVFVDGHVGEYE